MDYYKMDWRELVELLERRDYILFQRVGNHNDEFFVRHPGRTLLTPLRSANDVRKFAQEELGAISH